MRGRNKGGNIKKVKERKQNDKEGEEKREARKGIEKRKRKRQEKEGKGREGEILISVLFLATKYYVCFPSFLNCSQ